MVMKRECPACLRAALLLVGFAVLCFRPACAAKPAAADPNRLTGVPIVQQSGLMIVSGLRIALWGIDTLAPDQQCWQGDAAWPCGEQATTALRHYVDGRMVECQIQHHVEGAPAVAKCFRMKERVKKDIAEHMVSHGWALDKGEVSGGAYYAAEEEAVKEKRGVWIGRFQTAQDWREGIQRFVGEPAPDAKDDEGCDEDEE